MLISGACPRILRVFVACAAMLGRALPLACGQPAESENCTIVHVGSRPHPQPPGDAPTLPPNTLMVRVTPLSPRALVLGEEEETGQDGEACHAPECCQA